MNRGSDVEGDRRGRKRGVPDICGEREGGRLNSGRAGGVPGRRKGGREGGSGGLVGRGWNRDDE